MEHHKHNGKKNHAAEMWFIRKMLRISYMDRVTKEEVLSMANTKRKLLTSIRKQQCKFFGHVMTREHPEHLVTAEKEQGNKGRRRQRRKMIDGIASWLETKKGKDTTQRV